MAAPSDDRLAVEQERSRSQYYAWRYSHPREAEDPATAWAEAWRRGSWDAIRQNATLGLNLAQVIERLEELARLYADVDADERVDRELEESSAYWRSQS